MLHAVGRTEFDHAVVMVRDRLDALAPHFERQGFHLSEKAVHNLGSCNRLIVLEGTYVELLGWPPGAPPARKEIADSPLGLEALVFRTYDAEATYRRLLEAGFAVNPVQELTRAAQWQGREVQARFHTVRFAEQPIPGIRMYFCRHLTPELVWNDELLSHPNGARGIVSIEADAADAQAVAQRLAAVVDVPAEAVAGGWDVPLGNLRLRVRQDPACATPRLRTLTLENRDGAHYTLDTGV
ncbi:dioxygenase [Bordetella pertussis]|uniref:Glyoxalase-like domain-containing protein n=15 Tax=Bordetella TaxID=517 RepID=Q7VUR3_BORPE|nr:MULTISPECIES: VOC family protein [Bordetella]ETH40041.1 glyoxalase-like domain protein [Bordetella pertussis H918]ETH41539.1 glyoxalase-like domain protein [Bordetella pertussis H939]ETH49053.1 glyoxalase-like domain protein [Bordetella pertussis H921]ETH72071.1 glyoxalase-like domain protein [Bordetella pertussis STO1-CHLA-0011]ETH84366.1 glyoxalase-like domain protein [Bordetella pertussis STO1-CHOC-0017]ETH87817.1 glyoxalase-like domain protein [Bordetella pertussis STO1-CHOC-0018]ETH9